MELMVRCENICLKILHWRLGVIKEGVDKRLAQLNTLFDKQEKQEKH